MPIKELKHLLRQFKENEISKTEFFAKLALIEDEIEESIIIKNHYKKIASIGGKASRRVWTEDQKKAMVKKKAETLKKKA